MKRNLVALATLAVVIAGTSIVVADVGASRVASATQSGVPWSYRHCAAAIESGVWLGGAADWNTEHMVIAERRLRAGNVEGALDALAARERLVRVFLRELGEQVRLCPLHVGY